MKFPPTTLIASLLFGATALISTSGCTDDDNPPLTESTGGTSSSEIEGSSGGTRDGGTRESSGGNAQAGGSTGGRERDPGSGGAPEGRDDEWGSFSALEGIAVTALSYARSKTSVSGAAGASGEDDSGSVDYIEPTEAICTEDFEDFGCDELFPLFPAEDNCPGEQRIDFATAQACPVCLDPPEEEPSCEQTRRRFLEFIDHNLRETCSNFCEEDSDCQMWPLTGCGMHLVASLYGGIDEEPIAFSSSFDLDNCDVCPGLEKKNVDLPPLRPACQESQCVLVLDEDATSR